MAKGSNKVSDTVRTAVITVLASSTVFYMLGTMKNNDADLHISSETYKYSEGTHIFTDTAVPVDEPVFVVDADMSDETDVTLPDDTLTEDTQNEPYAEDTSETDSASEQSAIIAPKPTDTEMSQESDTLPATVSDNVENAVYWVENGEVWHVTDKCASLSRSKKILSGTVEQAMASGKARVCKRCGA